MRNAVVIVFALGLVILSGCACKENAAAEKAAMVAAQEWLAMVDDGNYATSWDMASGYFQTAVSREKWRESLQAVRAPLGKMLEWRYKSSRYVTSLPGAPDGDYVIIQYHTKFEQKKSAIETVTPMLDKDGQWKVSGYYLK